ncbi:MAG TPA: phosphodiester glycosidase family protein [Clostridia bacterium]|nr:phosphodiester glycosidase family protein [Clostridia bacterium]
MEKLNFRNRFLKRAIALAVAVSLAFPGVVYAKGTTKVYEAGQEIGPGTYYRNLNYITPNGKFMVNMMECNLDEEYLRVEVADGGSAIVNKPVSYQALQKNTSERRVIGATNGDFFDMTTIKGLTYGTSIIGGEIRTAVKSSTVLGITGSGDCFIDTLNMEGSVIYMDKEIAIDSVNRLRWGEQAVLYTPVFGKSTANTINGTDIVLRNVELPLKANKVYTGIIERIVPDSKITEIPSDGVVISLGSNALKQLAGAGAGTELSFSIKLDKEELNFAVSGAPRLLENGEVSPKIAERTDALVRNPRTAVGIKDNKLYLFTVDGRQPGYSDGMNLYELAELLLSHGVKDAINFDGGGSTTMVVRKQGEASAKVVNNPSDGRERYVGNSIQLVSTAPLSEPAILRFRDSSVKVFRNSSFKPSFYVMDKYYNVLSPDASKVKYGADGTTAKIAEDGTYITGGKAGKSYVEVAYGEVKARMPVEIVDQVSSLAVTNEFVHLDPGETVQMQVRAYDEKGSPVVISPSAVKWAVEGGIGNVDAKGVFTAGKKNGTGKIIASIGTVKAEVGAKNGKTPIIVADFGTLNNVEARVIRSVATVRHNQADEPVKSGKISLRLDYNFENTDGTSAAYVAFKAPVKIVGKPIELGAWVYGDASSHWLRGNYINAAGERKVMDFTENGGLDWKGWKYVYAELPADEKYPISLEQIYVAETEPDRKNVGSIYFDDVMAVYKLDKDYYDPEIAVELSQVAAGAEGFENIVVQPQEIGVVAVDRGIGIDPASIKMYINDKAVKAKFEPETGKISYIPAEALASGEYQVRITLKDKVGHSLNPEYSYTFKVE